MEVKLLMAYIIMIYDIQPQDERPPNWIFGDSLVPTRTAYYQGAEAREGVRGLEVSTKMGDAVLRRHRINMRCTWPRNQRRASPLKPDLLTNYAPARIRRARNRTPLLFSSKVTHSTLGAFIAVKEPLNS